MPHLAQTGGRSVRPWPSHGFLWLFDRAATARVVSHKSVVFGCSKNAPGQGVRTEPTRSGL